MSGSGNRFNFPQWNYGYTLGPPSQATAGDYSQFFVAQPGQATIRGGPGGPRGGGGAPRGPPMRGGSGRSGGQGKGDAKVKSHGGMYNESSKLPPSEPSSKKDDDTKNGETKTGEEKKEDGEIIERPINEILHGRNPIMFCNDQSKLRNLHMEWEQVSETGPPHDKTFTWSLKMGEMLTMGSANAKKGAKNKAAEEMVKKLDQLPKLAPKRPFQSFGAPGGYQINLGRGGGGFRGGRGDFRGGRGGRGGYGSQGYGPPPDFQSYGSGPPPKKPKKEPEVSTAEKEKAAAKAAEPLHPAQNNPISKLFEHTKKEKLPEPIFEVVQEEVLETRKSTQGFTYKKTKFTIQCEIMGKKFLGESMNKKTAKFNAAARAWEEIGGGAGVGGADSASIDSLLAAGRAKSS